MLQTEIINEIIEQKKIEAVKESYSVKSNIYKGKYGLRKEQFVIATKLQEKKFGLRCGAYSLIMFPNIFLNSSTYNNYFINHLSLVLSDYLGELNKDSKVLVVALGNRHISADSLGEKTIKNILVTSHLKEIEEFKELPKLSAVAAGVFGVTGIESYDIISGIISNYKPSKIIIIDTLCTNNYKRLGTSFQIHNAGIVPGSGINNARKLISKSTLNIDTITIGVPLVVYAQSFVNNAIMEVLNSENSDNTNGEDCCKSAHQKNKKINNKDLKELSLTGEKDFENNTVDIKHQEKDDFYKNSHSENKQLQQFIGILKCQTFNNMIVSFKDIEESVKICGKVIGYAINKAVLGYSIKQQNNFFNIV